MTNPGDYIWAPDYGAGLGRFIGQPASELRIRAAIRSQIFKEPSVARSPEPVIDIAIAPGGQAGMVFVLLRYVDAQTAATQILSFSVSS
jgi:phage baseplate assembly protein W